MVTECPVVCMGKKALLAVPISTRTLLFKGWIMLFLGKSSLIEGSGFRLLTMGKSSG